MSTRRAAFALLAMVFIAGSAVPAAAAPRRHGVPRVTLTSEGQGTLIALRYGSGASSHVHFLHAPEPVDRVALADLDHDGNVDVVAAPRAGGLMLWRYTGQGRFSRASIPDSASRPLTRGPHVSRLQETDDEGQWSDDGHDAAMPRAPDVIGDVPIAAVRITTPVYVRPASFRRFCGRAPPVL